MGHNKNKVLSIRIDEETDNSIDRIIQEFYTSDFKKSNFVKNFLTLSEVLIISGNKEYKGYDNKPLVIIPQELLNNLINYISSRNTPLYEIEMNIGDWIGLYFNDIFKLRNISDIRKKIEFIRSTGIGGITINNNFVAIPKSFGTEDLVYCLIHRIIYDRKMDVEMCPRGLDEKIEKAKISAEQNKKDKQLQTRYGDLLDKRNNLQRNRESILKIPQDNMSLNSSYVFDILNL